MSFRRPYEGQQFPEAYPTPYDTAYGNFFDAAAAAGVMPYNNTYFGGPLPGNSGAPDFNSVNLDNGASYFPYQSYNNVPRGGEEFQQQQFHQHNNMVQEQQPQQGPSSGHQQMSFNNYAMEEAGGQQLPPPLEESSNSSTHNQGAVKKKPDFDNNKSIGRNSSSRQWSNNNRRNDYRSQNNSRPQNRSHYHGNNNSNNSNNERRRALQETADFMRTFNQQAGSGVATPLAPGGVDDVMQSPIGTFGEQAASVPENLADQSTVNHHQNTRYNNSRYSNRNNSSSKIGESNKNHRSYNNSNKYNNSNSSRQSAADFSSAEAGFMDQSNNFDQASSRRNNSAYTSNNSRNSRDYYQQNTAAELPLQHGADNDNTSQKNYYEDSNNGRRNNFSTGGGNSYRNNRHFQRTSEVGDDVDDISQKNDFEDGGRKTNMEDARKSNFAHNNYRNNRDSRNSSAKFGKGNNGNSRHYESSAYGDRQNFHQSEKNNYWRKSEKSDSAYNSSNASRKCYALDAKKKLDAASQRERLEQMLARRILECLVCCEKVKHTDKIWSCQQCYHILHLHCVVAWANSSKLEDNGWRCPACQNVCTKIPEKYVCYCGKTIEPRPQAGVVPHACGESCLKRGRNRQQGCEHKCPMLCHPGPCPDCNVMVSKPCGCGSTTQTVKCGADIEIVCSNQCNKLLECGTHCCTSKCHSGPCTPCDHILEQECYCGKAGRSVKCTQDSKGMSTYSCDQPCGKSLKCGNHVCEMVCHEGPCPDCPRDVHKVKSCPCGRSELEKERTSCLDPIPCCEKVCGKILQCGQPAAPHTCKQLCHEGDCPPCPLSTFVRCRCGHMDKELPCQKVTTKADDARCEKKCTKKRLCGKHRCNQRCCIEMEHICPLPCNHLLTCGKHRCDRTCHSGRCSTCMETSFEELYCECGSKVLYPPIPCGTKPPACDKPCSRGRPCGHDVNHSCHTGACPPCTILCKRWCYGKHQQRSAIPCYQEDFSCGLPCGKPLSCGAHKCDRPCHLGPCPLPCKQKCQVKRAQCGHPCNAPCHKDAPCPETNCRYSVPVTCQCGLVKSTRPCLELSDEYKEIEMANLKDRMNDLLKDNQPVDISDIVHKPKRPSVLKILECTEECRVLDRNRRLAIGLQIRNPDLSQKLTPRYSDFMKGWAKKDPQFCQKVHDKLTELVQLAKQSKHKSRSHSFESMNRDKRHFIHEYCEHFGCESVAYDSEPNRNIIATAIKEKSWLPSMSLTEVIQRENGQRKVPGPVLSSGACNKTTATSSVLLSRSESVSLKLPGNNGGSNSAANRMQKLSASAQAAAPSMPSAAKEETIDYFDNPPQV